ncbi:type VI secretion system ImpA family N-terminal domain-containing protein [Pseudomonas sp. Ost2]|uniref:type VI secretion system ImpA family N-terminal domain-containing protein n=1 Tax=Pseudomonas sp. Ost2 TaxID=2678260 RepID=UPI002467B0A8|nr:type VI secretion system ImpA family N-terminal domain-containing protein [Pseudomonas sp. Ost2]
MPLLLAAVSANSPCGEDLEYDAQFLQLERDAQGKPERSMGDSVQPAEPPPGVPSNSRARPCCSAAKTCASPTS